jgi:hypothetical protein
VVCLVVIKIYASGSSVVLTRTVDRLARKAPDVLRERTIIEERGLARSTEMPQDEFPSRNC